MTEIKPAPQIDVNANRKAKKWRLSVMLARVCWMLISPLFVFSPRPLWIWRRIILRLVGAQIGSHVHVYPSVKITMPWNLKIESDAAIGDKAILYALGQIEIGERATVSQYAHLCAGSHDYRSVHMDLLKTPIQIGSDAWVCADAFVGPGVRVGDRAVLGARAVVTKSVPDDAIVAGNPAKIIGTRQIEDKQKSTNEAEN